jgi:Gpi18-like mannosyltransferase
LIEASSSGVHRWLEWLERRPGTAFWGHVAAFAVLALAVRIYGFPWASDDFRYFFGHWIDIILREGVQSWNSERYANYSPPIIYLLWASSHLISVFPPSEPALATIKVATFLGEVLLGFSAFSLARALGASKRWATLAVVFLFLVPTIALNASWWGQFDATYAAFILFSAAALFRKKIDASVGFFAAALCFKVQALFVLPAFAAFWLRDFLSLTASERKRVALRAIAFAVAAYAAAIFPAMTQGMAWDGIFRIYRGQPEAFRQLSMNAPNLWALFNDLDYETWVVPAICIGALGAVGIFFFAARKSAAPRPSDRLAWILFSAIAIPFLLPKMHDRYFFLAETLALLLAVMDRSRNGIVFLVGLEAVLIGPYGTYLFAWPKPPWVILVGTIAALAFVVAQSLLPTTAVTPSS